QLGALKPWERAKAIANTTTLRELIELMTPCSYRYVSYNFLSLLPEEEQHRTIEFRQHAGTMDIVQIVNWVSLCGGLVEYAHCASPLDFTETLLYNASRPDFDLCDLLEEIGMDLLIPFYETNRESEMIPTKYVGRVNTIFRLQEQYMNSLLHPPTNAVAAETQLETHKSSLLLHISKFRSAVEFNERGRRDGSALLAATEHSNFLLMEILKQLRYLNRFPAVRPFGPGEDPDLPDEALEGEAAPRN
ncbi:MAG: hypothetical protein M1838_005320, partial [Thelocarpon superellum]